MTNPIPIQSTTLHPSKSSYLGEKIVEYFQILGQNSDRIKIENLGKTTMGQVTVRYYGLYANAHRGKVRKASLRPTASVCTY
jgi:hypothetical protein